MIFGDNDILVTLFILLIRNRMYDFSLKYPAVFCSPKSIKYLDIVISCFCL